ncbi:MAG: hypothetical protein GXO10_02640 [Crenarchaeota archaeon]|nr:hypothetical protein [Thermoproteota archaeon]
MSVQVKFYTILGKYEDYEYKLRELILRIREQVKARGGDPEKINLTMIKVKEEALDLIYKYVRGEEEPPEYLRSLVEHLKLDNISTLPAIVINGRKICEGELIDLASLEKILIDEVKSSLGIDLRETPQVKREQVQAAPQPQREVEAKPYELEEVQKPPPASVERRPVETGVQQQLQIVRPRQHREIRKPPVHISSPGRGMPSNCGECIYYGFSTRYCFLLGRKVEDINRPPCHRENL